MSTEDFQGSAYAFRKFREMVQADIDAGVRKGVTVKWGTAEPTKTRIVRSFVRRVIQGGFRKKA